MTWTDPSVMKFDPFGILVGHLWVEVGMILQMINTLQIKNFVEIGVHKGGLATFLETNARYNSDFYYLGIEIDPMIVDSRVREHVRETPRCQLVWKDALHPETIKLVQEFITARSGPALIYCDGGNKESEFKFYSQVLRPGDWIAAHDFDYGGYERAEISQEHVKQVALQENLGLSEIYSYPYRIAWAVKGPIKYENTNPWD